MALSKRLFSRRLSFGRTDIYVLRTMRACWTLGTSAILKGYFRCRGYLSAEVVLFRFWNNPAIHNHASRVVTVSPDIRSKDKAGAQRSCCQCEWLYRRTWTDDVASGVRIQPPFDQTSIHEKQITAILGRPLCTLVVCAGRSISTGISTQFLPKLFSIVSF